MRSALDSWSSWANEFPVAEVDLDTVSIPTVTQEKGTDQMTHPLSPGDIRSAILGKDAGGSDVHAGPFKIAEVKVVAAFVDSVEQTNELANASRIEFPMHAEARDRFRADP